MLPCHIVRPCLCVWQYLVQSSIWVVLLREAGGHYIPLVTLEKATSSGYFWQQRWREGTLAQRTPQEYPQYTHPPYFHSLLFIQHPFIRHLLSRSIIYCKTDIQHYIRVKAIFLLKWISTHLLTWRKLWSHSFVMSLESLVCFSFIGVKVHRQVVCQWHHRLWFGVATVFTYKHHTNDICGKRQYNSAQLIPLQWKQKDHEAANFRRREVDWPPLVPPLDE